MIVGRDCFYKNCPTKGDEYSFVSDGKVQKQNWEDTPVDMIRWRTGNCFKTGADAIFAVVESTSGKVIFTDTDSGDIILAKGKTIGYLSQHQELASHNTILEELRTAKADVIEMEKQIRVMEMEMKQELKRQ